MPPVLLLTGCVSASRLPTPDRERPGIEVPAVSPGQQIAAQAIAQLGRPYRYGGHDTTGFDCSGLVFFVHAALGIATPRTTLEQFRAARPVPTAELAPGDLLFFRIGGRRVEHVAIYAGDGRFIHSPQTGRPVESRPLDDAYFQTRLLGVGRFY